MVTGLVCEVFENLPEVVLIRYTWMEVPGGGVGAFQLMVAVLSPAVAVTLRGGGVTAGLEEPELAVEFCPAPEGFCVPLADVEPEGGIEEVCVPPG